MGILDDFIKTIKGQRDQFKAEQKRAGEERASKEREKEAAKKAPGGKSSDYGYVGEVAERMKEQRRQFEEAQKKGQPAGKTVQEQKPADTVSLFGHTFKHLPGTSLHILLDDAGKAAYIDDVDAYLKSGGKIEVKGVTAAMDPYMYDIYTSQGGPVGQARYYRQENVIVSLVPDPFAKYRK
jgi:hypothetical protein